MAVKYGVNMGAIVFDYLLFEKIWGGNYFKDKLKVTDKNKMGELWLLSAINDKETKALNSEHKGKTLSEIYKTRDICGEKKKEKFPLLIKLISTSDNLSVQVHPSNDYAKKFENSLGKTEGWFVLDKSEQSKIIVGHSSKSKVGFEKSIKNNDYENLLNSVDVNIGDFYPIPAGTVHAIGKDILILEIQQSSDITYRLYDYDRIDTDGNKRELHIKKALDNIRYEKYNEKIKNIFSMKNGEIVWDNDYFSISVCDFDNETIINNTDSYLIYSLMMGSVVVENINLVQGQTFILPKGQSVIIKGNGKFVVVQSKE